MAKTIGKIPATYQRIREWLMYDGDPKRPSAPKLWAEDEPVYERMIQLRTLMFQKAHGYYDAMKVMMTTYSISEGTFIRDYRGLLMVFGDLEKGSRDFEKARLRELALKAYQVAAKKEDSKAMSAAVRNLITLGGFDRDEPEAIDADKLNPGAYALVLDESSRQMLLGLANGTGVIDLSTLTSAAQVVEDIDHEEIPAEK